MRISLINTCTITLIASVRIAAITSREPPRTRLSSRVGSYSQIAVAFSTATIFVMWDITSTFPRLTMWPRQLQENLNSIFHFKKKLKHTAIAVRRYSIRDLDEHVYFRLSCTSYYCYQCYLKSQCKARHRHYEIYSNHGDESTSQLTFDPFLSIIPTRSSNPTVYLPRFSPSCAPDKALNPITEFLIFHFPSFTSIQCAVTPWNPIFVVSADHPSWVMDIFPGATSCMFKSLVFCRKKRDLQLFHLSASSCALQTHCEDVT